MPETRDCWELWQRSIGSPGTMTELVNEQLLVTAAPTSRDGRRMGPQPGPRTCGAVRGPRCAQLSAAEKGTYVYDIASHDPRNRGVHRFQKLLRLEAPTVAMLDISETGLVAIYGHINSRSPTPRQLSR